MFIDKYDNPRQMLTYLQSLEGEDKITALNEIINDSEKIVFFGGAGVSTESGIPDFRSKDGLYNQHDVKFDQFSPEYLLSNSCLYTHPNVFFEFYRQKLDAREIDPNVTHFKLAELEKRGKLTAVITQNIDGLHQKAGSRKVYEIHGTTMRNYCMKCGKEFDENYIFNSSTPIPTCDKCGGTVRPDVTLYGENLPEAAWRQSYKAISEADCMIVAGTSLRVYPAAQLVDYFNGKYVVIMNRDKTSEDKRAHLVFHESMGKVFSRIE